MLIVLGIVCLILIIVGGYFRYRDDLGGFVEWFGIVGMIIIVICAIVNLYDLSQGITIDEKISMYEEENSVIESQIEIAVKQYQNYESGVFTEIGDSESYITLVALYPELKADELVNRQIDIYLNNRRKIIELKERKINEKYYKWWLYFGG